jgi:hypothetical protein
MEKAGIGPKDEDFIYGGGDLGEGWEGLGLGYLGVGDQWKWVLNLEYYSEEPRSIWEAKVVRERIEKRKSGKEQAPETIFPYYLKGHVMWKKAKPWEVPNIDPEPWGAGQPTTKPADKGPAKDQPSTPMSKDVPR